MKIGAAFGKMLSGESVIRDFLTIGIGDQIREKVYLEAGGNRLDVSGNQWLLGLDPRVIGIWISRKEDADMIEGSSGHSLYFLDGERVLGVLKIEYHDVIVEDNGSLFLFKVLASEIHHIDGMRAKLLYHKFYKKPGVDYERLKAVVAAYTYPRRVRVISFQKDAAYNYIFPMDLLADIKPAGRYLLGMRHSNQVLKNIMEVGKIVVAEAPATYKSLIYQLGRNHSVAPPPLNELPFGVVKTAEFGFYLPEWVESYKEIHIRRSLDLGSHMLLCGGWDSAVELKPETPRLHHIHFFHFLYLKSRGNLYPGA